MLRHGIGQKPHEGSSAPGAVWAVACGGAEPGRLGLDPSGRLRALSDPPMIWLS